MLGFVNLTQSRREESLSEELSKSDWPVGIFMGNYLEYIN